MNYLTPGYEDMELSTQILIKAAFCRGIKVKVLDRHEQILQLTKGKHTEYVKQATCTSADSYIVPLLMENKEVTKQLLSEAGIRVPDGRYYNTPEIVKAEYLRYAGLDCVIKPNNTNFGRGISILIQPFSFYDFSEGVDIAFSHDKSIIVEEYIRGTEYRFLVIDKRTVGVLERIPANITGDGIRTVSALIEEKNDNPLRGTAYRSPLEKIRLGETELSCLNEKNLTPDSVLPDGCQVFLRKNSNISTGGDSYDHTDTMPREFASLAVHASSVLGARICGVDIIVRDISRGLTEGNYAVIELNFNPALHIHDFPLTGKSRDTGNAVLNLLNF